jgi:hypothetical protein
MSRPTAQPRTRCRLPCIIRAGRGRARARLLDVSAGGLCFVGPVCFKQNARVQVEIAVPRRGAVAVEGAVRHRRPFEQPSSGRRGWATGLALATVGPDFLALSSPGAVVEPIGAEQVVEALQHISGARALDEPDLVEEIAPDLLIEELSLFRIRLKAVDSSRTRTLTLRAVSESAVCEAVLRDLAGNWVVLGVEANPLD